MGTESNESKDHSLYKKGTGFRHALKGIHVALSTQHNLVIHLAATVVVILAGILLVLSTVEWGLVIFAIGLVLTAEILNTSIESLVDWITADRSDQAKRVKDLAAGGVLTAAATAAMIGSLIFLPKIFRLI